MEHILNKNRPYGGSNAILFFFVVAAMLIALICVWWDNAPFGDDQELIDWCYEDYNSNGEYYPTKREIRGWLADVRRARGDVKYILINGKNYPSDTFFMLLISAESTGNPAAKSEKNARGLMGVRLDAASDSCKRRDITNNNIAISLYNPTFNIECGVDHWLSIYGRRESARWATTVYHAGERRIAEYVAAGIGIKHSHWKRIMEKLNQFEGR